MTDNQNAQYIRYRKNAWIIYYVLAAALVTFLVLCVAQDNEERFFYGLMTAAVSYVFRPTEKFMRGVIAKITGVVGPEEDPAADSNGKPD